MTKFLTLIMAWCVVSGLAFGQADVRRSGASPSSSPTPQGTRRLTGKVVDSGSQPLVGASVSAIDVVNGKVVTGGYTDGNGAFSVTVPDGFALRILITYIGYRDFSVNVPPTGSQSYDVTLDESSSMADEVVVIGYGTKIKRDLTGAVGNVSGEDIAQLPVTSVEQSLQGRMAGVQISSSSGKLGQGFNVRIRGSASLSASNAPLYVVDGIIFNNDYLATNSYSGEANNPLADLNPNDIESVDVLKDAAAAAIYGARAANGVVIITTKRGKIGKSTTTLNFAVGISSPTRRRDFMNTSEYVNLMNESWTRAAGYGGGPVDFGVPSTVTTMFGTNPADVFSVSNPSGTTFILYDPNVDNDWDSKVLLNNRPMTQIDISNSGGSERTQHYISFSYLEQFGILIGNHLTRATGRFNLDHKVSDKVKVGGSFMLARTLNERISSDRDFASPLQAVALAPLDVDVDPATGEHVQLGVAYFNPLVTVGNRNINNLTLRNLSKIYVEFSLLKDFTWHSDIGVDLLDMQEDFWTGLKIPATVSGYPAGAAIAVTDRVTSYITSNYLTWNSSFSEHHKITSTAGFEFQYRDRKGSYVEGQDFASDDFKWVENAARITLGSSFIRQSRFMSFFWRADYKFNNKLLVGGSIRFDGSSRFGPGGDLGRYGFFPAVSAAYILSEEEFIKDLGFVSLIKPRVSWGRTGNPEIGDYPWQNLYASGAYKTSPNLAPQTTIGDRKLQWEQVSTYNIGLDLGFFNDRLYATIEWYRRTTEGMLLNVLLPYQSGYASSIRNLGSLENRGWEFMLGGRILDGEVKLSANANLAINRSEVLGLNPQDGNAPVFAGSGGMENRAAVGQPLSSFYGVHYLGVDPATGDALFQGPNGPTTSFSTALNARQYLGSPFPIYNGGVTLNASWKGIDFTMFWQFALDFKVYNWSGRFMSANGDYFDNSTVDQGNFWRKPGDITNVPEPRILFGNGTQQSDRYLFDGDYWRLKTMTIGYTLPSEWVSKVKLSKVRVYVTGQNLLTLTKYPGWDPEVNSLDRSPGNVQGSNLNVGWDFYTAPQPRTWLFGIQLTY